MKFILNALDQDNLVIVGGKHFQFKPNQIKPFYSDDIAHFILKERAEFGFVEIPKIDTHGDEGMLDDYDKSPEGQEIINSKRREGIEAYCARLTKLVYNLQVSLKRDLEMKNRKEDPRIYAGSADLKHMEELVKYRAKKEDSAQIRVDKLKMLEKQLEKN